MLRTDGTDGGPAFPQDSDQYGPQGMSLRDWFAGQALANPYSRHDTDHHKVAIYAYAVADAMLAARDK